MSSPIDQLRGDHRVAATGRLAVDRAQALEKLRKFRLANPYQWVLQLVRAASILGSKQVDFTVDADEVDCRFDVGLPTEVVTDLWNRGYEREPTPEDRAAYQIALALSAASALAPTRIVVESGAGEGARLTVVSNKQRAETGVETVSRGTRVYLRERLRVGHLVDAFEVAFLSESTHPEVAMLEKHCAYASMPVRVNGSRVDRPLKSRRLFELHRPGVDARVALRREVESPLERLRGSDEELTVALCNHEVMADVVRVSAHGYAAFGIVDSDYLQLDLSSLRRVAGHAANRATEVELVYGPYHALLAERVRDLTLRAPHSFDRMLVEFTSWKMRQEQRGLHVGSGSEALWEAILDAPIWERADGEDDVSIADALDEERGTILIADHRHTAVEITDRPILYRHFGTRQQALGRVAELLGVELDDRSEELADAHYASLRFSEWREQERYSRPEFRHRREVRVGGSKAWVFIPQEKTFGPKLSELRSVRIFASGRPVEFRTDDSTPFGFTVEGDFRVADDRVVRDGAFERLAREVVEELPKLVDQIGRGQADRELYPALHGTLLWWVRHVVDGTYRARLYRQLGLGVEAVQRLEETPPGRSNAELLGRPRDALSFREWRGPDRSLRSVEKTGEVQYVSPDTAAQLDGETTLAHDLQDATVLVLDDIERAVLAPLVDLRDAREDLIAETLRARHLTKPEFVDDIAPDRVIDCLVDTDAARRIQVSLIDATWPGCEVFLIYEDRVLGIREFRPEFGRFRVELRSPHLKPNTRWSDAESTPRLEFFLGEVRALAADLLFRWWDETRRGDAIPTDPFGQTLYFGVAIRRLVEQRADRYEPALPVVELGDDGTASEALASWEALRQNTAALGYLPFVRGSLPDSRLLAEFDAPALVVGHGVDDEIIQHLFPAARLRDVTRTIHLDDLAAEGVFRSQIAYPRTLLGALVTVPVDDDVLAGEIGYFAADGGRIDISILHDGKLLTSVTEPIAFGTFRAVVHGRAVRPNATFDGVSDGLDVIRTIVKESAHACLGELCRRFESDDDVALSALRRDALALLAWARTSDDASPELVRRVEASPLLRGTDGRRLAVRDLTELSEDGVLPIADDEEVDGALYVAAEDEELLRRALRELRLERVEGFPGSEASNAAARSRDEGRRQRWLDETSRALSAISPDVQSYVARAQNPKLSWSSRGLDGNFCEVRGRYGLVDPRHPFVDVLSSHARVAPLFAASVVATEVNRRSRHVADIDDFRLQRALLQEPAGE